MSEFLTIRETANDPRCPIREGTLRTMVKRKEVPGFYVGTRFWVDVDGLLVMLAERSRLSVRSEMQ